ncbi:hypothetical protein N0V93_010157 [Gnomoniopsis smithogilvyi]|uniref:Rhodopsin domain-containing protein n=1 Tax=Gnomoniopsis smithogilvyi TaxID=1191159 RepID=A0A9W8YIE5_9PEZI|nr:hypothetical protein N0V93_010157 [Gnomoniopsis smithogilvyi]
MSIWDSNDLGDISVKVSWALFGPALFTFGLRVFCRLQYSPRLGGGLYIDDFITLACLIVLFLFCILVTVAHEHGTGEHFASLSALDQVQSLKWSAILLAVTPWICTLPKFAIITTLSRILNYGTKTKIAFWGLALSSQAMVLGLMIWGLVQCSPTPFQWDKSIEGGWCADPNIYMRFGYVTYMYSTVLDVFFALYPVPFVMRLNMPLAARLGVAISLSLSLAGFAISVYKFTLFPQLGAILPTDPSFPMVYLAMTHAAEGSFLIISTSLATLRPLYRGIKQQVVDRSLTSAFTRRPASTIKYHASSIDPVQEDYSDGKQISGAYIGLFDRLNRPSDGESELDLALRIPSGEKSPVSSTSEGGVDEKC